MGNDCCFLFYKLSFILPLESELPIPLLVAFKNLSAISFFDPFAGSPLDFANSLNSLIPIARYFSMSVAVSSFPSSGN